MKTLPRVFAALLGFAATAWLGSATLSAEPSPEPPAERLAGKLAWAELLTSGYPADAAPFYSAVFGWRAETVGTGYDARVTFFVAARPVAAIAHRQAEQVGPTRTRWLLSFAVADPAAAAETARLRDGKILVSDSPSPRAYTSRAILADPEGAVFGLVPAKPGETQEYAAAAGEWVWPILFARRPDLSVNFYRDVLGHEVHPDARTPLFSGDFVLADGPRARAAAMALLRGSPGRPGWLGLVRVTDLEATVRTVREQGGDVLRAPTDDLIGGRIAVVSDPFGAVFGLVQLTAATGPHAAPPARAARLRP